VAEFSRLQERVGYGARRPLRDQGIQAVADMDYWHEESNDRALSHVIVWASVPAIEWDMRPGAAVVLVAIRDSSIPGAVAFCYDLLRVEGVWLVALAGNSASIREIDNWGVSWH
jgi:aspartate/methionine/tyrosine aminotransferase